MSKTNEVLSEQKNNEIDFAYREQESVKSSSNLIWNTKDFAQELGKNINAKEQEYLLDTEYETSPCCDAKASNGRCMDCGDNFE